MRFIQRLCASPEPANPDRDGLAAESRSGASDRAARGHCDTDMPTVRTRLSPLSHEIILAI